MRPVGESGSGHAPVAKGNVCAGTGPAVQMHSVRITGDRRTTGLFAAGRTAHRLPLKNDDVTTRYPTCCPGSRAQFASRSGSSVDRRQRLPDIRNKIVGMFDAHRKSDRRIGDAYASGSRAWVSGDGGSARPLRLVFRHRRSRTFFGTPEWVVEAGWQTSDSVAPSDTASVMIFSAFSTRNASASPPTM